MIYFIFSFVSTFLIWFFLIKKDFKEPINNKTILTENINYIKKDMNITAERMNELGNKKEFENIVVRFGNIVLYSKKASTSDMNKITFTGEVRCINIKKDSFTVDSLIYDFDKKTFEATGKFHLKTDGIDIKSDFCSSLDDFKSFILRDNIVIKKENTTIKCTYAKKELEGSFVIYKAYVQDDNSKIETNKLVYYEKENRLEGDEKFILEKDNYKVEGNGFYLKDRSLQSYKELVISNEKEGLKLSATQGIFKENIELEEVKGNYKDLEFQAQNLMIEDKNISMKDQISLTNKSFKVSCEELIYNDKDKLINLLSEANISTNDFSLKSKSFSYDINNKIIKSDEIVKISNDYFNIEGLKFIFEENKNRFSLEQIDSNSKDFNIKAGEGTFNFDKKIHILKDNVEIKNDQFYIRCNSLNVENENYILKQDVDIFLYDRDVKIKLRDGYYDNKNKEFTTENDVVFSKDNSSLKTKGMIYQLELNRFLLNSTSLLETENSKVSLDKIVFESNDNILNATNIKGTYKNAKILSKLAEYKLLENTIILSKDIKIEKDDIILKSERIKYLDIEDILLFEEETEIKHKDLLVIAQTGKFSLNSNILFSEKSLVLRDKGDILESGSLFLDYKTDEIILKDGVDGDLINGMKFKSKRANIFFGEDLKNKYKHKIIRIELKENVEYNYQNIKMLCNFIEYDDNLKWLYAKDDLKINLFYNDGSADIISTYAFLDIDKEIGKMKNKVIITYKSEKMGSINTSSSEAMLKYKERYVSLKGDVKSYSSKGELEVYGDEANLDLNTAKLVGKGSSGFTYLFDKKKELIEEEVKEELEEEGKEQEEIDVQN